MRTAKAIIDVNGSRLWRNVTKVWRVGRARVRHCRAFLVERAQTRIRQVDGRPREKDERDESGEGTSLEQAHRL
jgi:hypothetical protein